MAIMKSALVLSALAFGLCQSASLTPEGETKDNPLFTCYTNPCVTVDGIGKILGTKKESEYTGRNIYSYYSIPYGKPTGGEKRFAPPEPYGKINDGSYRFDGSFLTYLLNWMGKVCPQAGVSLKESYVKLMSEVAQKDTGLTPEERTIMKNQYDELATKSVTGSEDCLHLAVFTPRSPKDLESGTKPLLPVMFFIHGGAFYMGTYFGMGPKVLLEQDVVLVEIQYRLGPLGYMCLDHPDAAGNMGMLDQVLALDWVRDHIKAFGGDANQITIFGESAGSASASYHMLSPLSQNKFQRLIGESGSALAGWAFDKEPVKHAKEIAGRVGCPTDNDDDLIRCMKSKDLKDIVDTHTTYIKNERYNGRMGFGGTSPCAQTHGSQIFLSKHPEDILQAGEFEPKPVVFGTNKHEGSFVLGVMYNNYIEPRGLTHNSSFLRHNFVPVMLNALGLDDSSGVIFEVVEHDYFNITDLGDWDKMMPGMINLVGTFFLKAATYEFMKYNSMHGGQSNFYSFEYEGENSIFNLLFSQNSPPLPHGVTHADELIYLFSTGLFDRLGEDEKISKKLGKMWTDFATTGTFRTAEQKSVPLWTETEPYYLKIDAADNVLYDYISTWNNPDRNDFCPNKH